MSDDQPAKEQSFDPSRYLTKVGASDYLEVKWRLVWLRDLHPDADLETDLHSNDGSYAVFRAKITIPNGGGSATGWGSEGMDDFRDYLEKAETKAIGRALAALGFGTQFTPDFDFGAGHGKVVDSPVDFASRRQTARPAARGGLAPPGAIKPITDAQMKFLIGLAKDLGMVVIGPDGDEHHDEAAMNAAIREYVNDPDAALTKLSAARASDLIEEWKAKPKVARR